MSATTPTKAPRTVTIAVRLIYAFVVLLVISVPLRAILIGLSDSALSLVGGLLYGLLAYYVGRGKNVARILVWVCAAGTAGALVVLVAGKVFSGGVAGHPGWYFWFVLTLSVLQPGGLTVASILLAQPAARPYFRHHPPIVTPG